METKTLIVVDSYLSNLERAGCCEKLIKQIRQNLPEFKILLINKSNNNFGLETKVDYYFNFGDSFMVGYPPTELIESTSYCAPYVYHETQMGILENWMPLTGVTDHVAGIYNSFILSSQIANLLGYEKIFKIEYDTYFDTEELLNIKNEIEKFEDYLFFGNRHEGQWTEQNLIDLHIVGYKTKLFDNFEIVKNDIEYWKLCKKVGYIGKWIEYLVPAILEYQKDKIELNGTVYSGKLRVMFPKTNFDVLNGLGVWTEKWKTIPMVGKISLDQGKSELNDKVCLFFLNLDFENISISTKVYKNNSEIFSFEREIPLNWWYYYELDIDEEIFISSEYISSDGYKTKYEKYIGKQDINKLTYRILKK